MLIISGKSDRGKVREKNEDRCFTAMLSEHAALAVVCDGMGGQNGGYIASGMTVDEVSRHIWEGYDDTLEPISVKALILSAVLTANQKVYERAGLDSSLRKMGTTLELALVRGDKAYLAHVGDSSMFYLTSSGLEKLTVDHTVVQLMVENGQLSQQEAKTHPKKHFITRAVGVEEALNVDYFEHTIAQGEGILLCSDGVTNELSERDLFELVRDAGPRDAADALVEAAIQCGGHDNVTAVLLTQGRP